MKRMKQKLRARAGETLTETLAALLVGVIALAILAGMVMSSSKLIHKSRTWLSVYYTSDAVLNSMKTADGTSAEVDIKDEAGNALRLTDAQTDDSIDVLLFKNSENSKVSAYRIQ